MSNLPPGTTTNDVDRAFGCDPQWERVLDSLPHECPNCGQNVFPDPGENANDYGLGFHVNVVIGDHAISVTCNGPVMNSAEEPVLLECETELYSARCRCRECDPPDAEREAPAGGMVPERPPESR